MITTTHTCDMCKKVGEPWRSSYFYAKLDVVCDEDRKYRDPKDLCFNCYRAVEDHIEEYAKKNRLSILITEGRAV